MSGILADGKNKRIFFSFCLFEGVQPELRK
jgi:hypothetical protein